MGTRGSAIIVLATIGAVGPLVLVVTLIATAMSDPAVARNQTISVAAVRGRHARLLTVAMLAHGVGLLAAAAAVLRCFPAGRRHVALAISAVSLAGLTAVAVPCGPGCFTDGVAVTEIVHTALVVVGIGGMAVAPHLANRCLTDRDRYRHYRRYGVATSLGVLLATAAWGWGYVSGTGGLGERIGVLVGSLWFAVTALVALRLRNRGEGRTTYSASDTGRPGARPR